MGFAFSPLLIAFVVAEKRPPISTQLSSACATTTRFRTAGRATGPSRSAILSAAQMSAADASDRASSSNNAGRIVAVGAALSSVIQGYSTGVIGGALLFIVPEFGLEARPAMQGLIVTATTIGSLVGTVTASRLSDSAGRRGTLLLTSSIFVTSGLLLTWAPNALVLIFARLLVGLGIGNAGAVVPVYIAECADKETRGALSIIPQLCISSGVFLSYLVSLLVSMSGAANWRFMTGFSLLLALLQCATLVLLPESPRWLLRKGDEAAARLSLQRLRGAVGTPALVDDEFAELQSGLKAEQKSDAKSGTGGWKALLEPRLAKLLALCVSLQALQQLSGINAIVYYTPQTMKEVGVPLLFERLGFGEDSASLLATMLSYAPKLPSLLLTMYLIDRVGRKRLLQTFVPLMGLCHFGLASAFSYMNVGSAWPRILAVASICLYGSAFAFSLGPIPNILTAEVFPMRARAAAMSISLAAQFILNILVGFGFPVLRHALGTQAVFTGFGIICIAALPFVNKFVFETKGESLEQLSTAKSEEKDR